MPTGAIALLCGMFCLHGLASLQAWHGAALAGSLLCLHRRPLARLAGCFLLGFFWAWLHGQFALARSLPAALDGEVLHVTGVVVSLPISEPLRTRFRFEVDSVRSLQRDWPFRGRLDVSDYSGTLSPHAGERWRLALRARVPLGQANPGSFDVARWLLEQGLAGRASVVAVPSNRRLATDAAVPLQRWRERLRDAVLEVVPDSRARALILALLIGERAGLAGEDTAVLRATGTAHLLAISGLHIGLVAGLGYWLGRAVLPRLLPGRRLRPATPILLALVLAIGYAALAGWSVPTRRAVIMIATASVLRLGGRRLRWPRLLALTATVLALSDPLALLAPGFWLSMSAVIIIALAGGTRGEEASLAATLRRVLRSHVALAFAMAPLLALVFAEVSLIAPLANLLAVPLVGVLLAPLLVGGVLTLLAPGLAAAVLAVVALGLDGLWRWLVLLAELPLADVAVSPGSPWLAGMLIVAALLGLAPAGLGLRPLCLAWCLPVLLATPPRPPPGHFQLVVLDVGQGLSALVLTRSQALLFDTGARYASGYAMAEAVVLPYLRRRGIRRLDTLVISHGDNDHAGGAGIIIEALRPARIRAGPDQVLAAASPCRRGERWQHDGVRFAFVHPDPAPGPAASDNDLSCVLRISNGVSSVLLPGDIEAGAEALLLARDEAALQADLLLAPHHGSRSSSTPAFVAAVAPRQVIVPAAVHNRYGLPHAEVLQRYRALGARVLITGAEGMLVYDSAGSILQPGWRRAHRRWWHPVAPP